jgi:hypothetical protein
VLQNSVEKIRKLKQLCSELRSACHTKDERLQALSEHLISTADAARESPPCSCSSSSSSSALSLLSPPIRDCLSFLCHHRSLVTSSLLHSQISLLLLDIVSGICLDANQQFFSISGWSREEIVGRIVAEPYEAMMGCNGGRTADRRLLDNTSNRPLARQKGEDGVRWAPSRPVAQYPRTIALVRELCEGKRSSFTCVWRCRSAEGVLSELESIVWVCQSERVVEADGRTWDRPVSSIAASGFSQRIQMDEW